MIAGYLGPADAETTEGRVMAADHGLGHYLTADKKLAAVRRAMIYADELHWTPADIDEAQYENAKWELSSLIIRHRQADQEAVLSA